jgi:hypothetical protein
MHPSNKQQDSLEDIFAYHAPTEIQVSKYSELRKAGLEFARVIVENTPGCADQSAAIRKVREAVMLANAAIALDEEKVGPI